MKRWLTLIALALFSGCATMNPSVVSWDTAEEHLTCATLQSCAQIVAARVVTTLDCKGVLGNPSKFSQVIAESSRAATEKDVHVLDQSPEFLSLTSQYLRGQCPDAQVVTDLTVGEHAVTRGIVQRVLFHRITVNISDLTTGSGAPSVAAPPMVMISMEQRTSSSYWLKTTILYQSRMIVHNDVYDDNVIVEGSINPNASRPLGPSQREAGPPPPAEPGAKTNT